MKNRFDWEKGFGIDFDLSGGHSKNAEVTRRYLSQMEGVFADETERKRQCRKEDVLVYEFYELGAPEDSGDLSFGTTVLYPGKVGKEYYMTKGHFHTILDTGEVYYGLSGTGYLLTENKAGDIEIHKICPGEAVYVGKGYAHRTINTGDTPLVMLYVFRADAGHDYETIRENGFLRRCVEKDGEVEFFENHRG